MLTANQIIALANQYTSALPLRFVVSMAFHESGGDESEVDDYKSGKRQKAYDSEADGKEYTVGLFQCSHADLAQVTGDGSGYVTRLQDPDLNTRVFCGAMEKNLSRIREASGVFDNDTPDLWAYLAISHNQGLGAALQSINAYGMNWAAYKQRNAGSTTLPAHFAAYGDDAISGGQHWPSGSDTPDAPDSGGLDPMLLIPILVVSCVGLYLVLA
jgi:hypothetical protein